MLSVLYVDDEPGLLEIGKIFLERGGNLKVDIVSSPLQALSLIAEFTYDCVISDYQMPGMDGLELLKKVRETWRPLPFILFTGKGREEVVIEALNNGADFYLQKGGEPRSQFAELEHKVRLAAERRQVSAELRNSERMLTDLIDFLPDPTFAIDLDGKVIAWNRAVEEMTGINKKEVLGCGDLIYSVHLFGEKGPLLIDHVLREFPDAAKLYPYIAHEGDKFIAERFVPNLNGGAGAYLWLVASPIYNSEGDVIGAIESIRDITSRKRAEEELRAAFEQLAATEEELRQQYQDLAQSEKQIRDSERRLNDIISFLPDATFAIDQDGIVIAWNHAMEEMTGVSRAEMLGTGDFSYAVPIWGIRRPMLIDAVLRGDPSVEAQYKSLTKKGNKFFSEVELPHFYGGKGGYFWFTATPLYNSEGEVIGAIESIRDVTEHKREQDELRAAYEQIAATEEELRQQYKDLAWGEARIREDERFINDVFSSIQDGITVLDTDLCILKTNQAMDGLSHDNVSILGKRCYEVYHKAATPCADCPALHTLRTGHPSHKIIKGRGEGEKSGQLDVYTYPLYDSVAGKMTGVIEYVRGITERTRSEPDISVEEKPGSSR
ncbi:PAS domain-containing protein [uncultured Methanospirillum sp.]|uniref:response regulator n=1 Tax=uncultured Methanospirillum sp. TaxID=262503 RepID=UPI0029C80690|nr:PAS domain-containing protein [uncultured Methanospirillum sp.]